MSSNFNDQFSAHAKSYAAARPDYPAELFSYLKTLCNKHELAWDCATGNGQAAKSLAKIFTQVIATDASIEQIQQAQAAKNIEYRQMSAEEPFLQPGSVDLISVAQALHWFDTEAFYKNADSVLCSGGVLAVWSYGLPTISNELDRVVMHLYANILNGYWPAERRIVEEQYANINFPYALIEGVEFHMTRRWSLQQLTDYLASWSAVRRYIDANNSDPMQLVRKELIDAWAMQPEQDVEVRWPMVLKLGKKS
ncbi:MAG: SAM-dependent methyltransferase [SAR86 cluster bacterium]|uniref:SAM-dependent methyltransferase n=1 Tax=SAR86 cluster bacterium TaxID=2030880 RepID=A0A2A5BCD5_9GAMM|nr:MAG: SAM-dependent methyltransferase [SAR86 cluster bacterium]